MPMLHRVRGRLLLLLGWMPQALPSFVRNRLPPISGGGSARHAGATSITSYPRERAANDRAPRPFGDEVVRWPSTGRRLAAPACRQLQAVAASHPPCQEPLEASLCGALKKPKRMCSLPQRHPFRAQSTSETYRGKSDAPKSVRNSTRAACIDDAASLENATASARAPVVAQPLVCMVQGSQCAPSSLYSLASLAAHLHSRSHAIHIITPDSMRAPCASVREMLEEHAWTYFNSAADLRRAVTSLSPQVILLSSHDACFKCLRRDPRTIRWTHEVPRCYDPQASRCTSPLFATNATVCAHLPGFAGEARTFWDWARTLATMRCEYNPGPLRVCGVGHTYDPRSNFKAFQVLVEKYSTIQFVWLGASCNKHWHNLELLTDEADFCEVLTLCDILLWCPDGDPCPVAVFQALYLGVRVHLFQKAFPFNIPTLCSSADGTALLDISTSAPQHAPLHAVGKNPKRSEDVARARSYVDEHIATAPQKLVEAIEARLSSTKTPI